MTATVYTQRLIIVVKAAVRQLAEDVAVVADPEGGAGTFVPGTPLRADGGPNTAAAYWTAWTMTQDQRDRLIAEFGRRAGAVTVYTKASNVPTNVNYWLFETADQSGPAVGFTPDEVLALLPYDRFVSTLP